MDRNYGRCTVETEGVRCERAAGHDGMHEAWPVLEGAITWRRWAVATIDAEDIGRKSDGPDYSINHGGA